MIWWPRFTHPHHPLLHIITTHTHTHRHTYRRFKRGWSRIAWLHTASNWSLLFLFSSSHLLHSLSAARPLMFSVVLAVSDPPLLSVAALSTGERSPRVYLRGGISVGEQATCSGNIKQGKRDEPIPLLLFLSFSFAAVFASSAPSCAKWWIRKTVRLRPDFYFYNIRMFLFHSFFSSAEHNFGRNWASAVLRTSFDRKNITFSKVKSQHLNSNKLKSVFRNLFLSPLCFTLVYT